MGCSKAEPYKSCLCKPGLAEPFCGGGGPKGGGWGAARGVQKQGGCRNGGVVLFFFFWFVLGLERCSFQGRVLDYCGFAPRLPSKTQ